MAFQPDSQVCVSSVRNRATPTFLRRAISVRTGRRAAVLRHPLGKSGARCRAAHRKRHRRPLPGHITAVGRTWRSRRKLGSSTARASSFIPVSSIPSPTWAFRLLLQPEAKAGLVARKKLLVVRRTVRVPRRGAARRMKSASATSASKPGAPRASRLCVCTEGRIFPGQAAVLDLGGERAGDLVVKSPVAIPVSLQLSGGFGSGFPDSLMGALPTSIRFGWTRTGAPKRKLRTKKNRAASSVPDMTARKPLSPTHWKITRSS